MIQRSSRLFKIVNPAAGAVVFDSWRSVDSDSSPFGNCCANLNSGSGIELFHAQYVLCGRGVECGISTVTKKNL